MKVAVYGTGGVGGYFGGRLARSGVDVSFLARGALRALRAEGLRVRSIRGDFTVSPVAATDDPADVGPVDYVFVTVKSHQTEQVAGRLAPLLHDGTAVLSLQNGVDNEEKLAVAVGADRVIGGAAYIFATIAEPGVIAHTGGPASLVIGEWTRDGDGRVGRLVDASREAGIDATETEDIRTELWSKFAFICAQAGTTAAIRLPIGEIRTAPASRELFRRLSAEVCAVARAEGIEIPADLPDRHLTLADTLESGSFSSLHHDLVEGKAMELEALLGEVVRRAARAGVDTAANRVLYAVLQPWERRNRR